MTISISDHRARLLRLYAQRLVLETGPVSSPATVIKDVCGLQAQELPAAALAVRARSTGLTASDVDRARLQERSVVRTWAMRGTLHLIAAEDYGWLISLLGPVFIPGHQRRLAQLGLDRDTTHKAVRIIQETLGSQGPMVRGEIAGELDRHGIKAEGQARIHLIYRAALEGILCVGPDRGVEPSYVLAGDWIDRGRTLTSERSLAELAHRYLQAYGPATPQDLAAWSGLSLGDARRGWQQIQDRLTQVEVGTNPAWMVTHPVDLRPWMQDDTPGTAPSVRLLARFDTYLLGYAKRDLAVAREYTKRINRGGGILHPVLLVDGRVAGTWRSLRRKDRLEVVVEPFEALSEAVQRGIEAETIDIGRFLGVATEYKVDISGVQPE